MPVAKCVIRIKIAIFVFAMKIIENSQNFLDLQPLEVCFLVTPRIKAEYGATLESLNNKPEFTKGVLTFRVLMRSDVNIDSAMPDDLKEAFYGNNMVMRLPDDEDGNCIYAFENIDFTLFPSIPVMPFNYNYSSDGTLRAGFLTNAGRSTASKILQNVISDESAPAYRSLIRTVYKLLSVIPPENPPKSLHVTVRKIDVEKYGKMKKEWGVAFNVDDKETSIQFGSTDQVMLYICTLISVKYGWKVSRGKFNTKWIEDVYNVLIKDDLKTWLGNFDGHRCDQAMSQVNNLIWDAIPDTAFYYFTLLNINSSYCINIEPENIFLPPELSNLKGEILE